MNWAPFRLATRGQPPQVMRSIDTPEGVGDRLRAAAFAELQAREAFTWAADRFKDAPPELRSAWRALVAEEENHLQWLLGRMEALGQAVSDRKVSDKLWKHVKRCKTGEQFAAFISTAEERGRQAAHKLRDALKADPQTAEVLERIATEEVRHVDVAKRFYGQDILVRAKEILQPLAP